jgi:hypothetical protein
MLGTVDHYIFIFLLMVFSSFIIFLPTTEYHSVFREVTDDYSLELFPSPPPPVRKIFPIRLPRRLEG